MVGLCPASASAVLGEFPQSTATACLALPRLVEYPDDDNTPNAAGPDLGFIDELFLGAPISKPTEQLGQRRAELRSNAQPQLLPQGCRVVHTRPVRQHPGDLIALSAGASLASTR